MSLRGLQDRLGSSGGLMCAKSGMAGTLWAADRWKEWNS